MRQLSENDAVFLASESAHSNSNVSLVQIYDPSTAPGGRLQFKSLLALVQSRLHRSPIFRQKLRSVPFGLDEPYWIEDENFDLEYHVRHIALPKPGDWRQFCIQASRIHARPLDLNRPLWEIYLIEGLDSLLDLPKDSFALLTKLHHAAIDVRRGTAIITLLHDTTAAAAEARAARAVVPRVTAEPARARLPRPRARGDFAATAGTPASECACERGPCRALVRSRVAATARSASGDALQLHRVALPGVRDAALPAQRVPRDPPARPRRQDQRRRARRMRWRAAQVPRSQRRVAGTGSVDADARLCARPGGRTRQPARSAVGARDARHEHHRPGEAAGVHQGADGVVPAHIASDRRARAHRYRNASTGRHVGDHRQVARPRAARGGSARADRELRDHQRAGSVGSAVPQRRPHDVLLRDHADQRRSRPRLRGDELRREDHRIAHLVPRADAGSGGLRAVRARLLPGIPRPRPQARAGKGRRQAKG